MVWRHDWWRYSSVSMATAAWVGGMRIVPPPDHLHGDWRGVSQLPEDDAVAPVLGRGAFRSDADAAVRLR